MSQSRSLAQTDASLATPTRRDFLKSGTAAGMAGSLLAGFGGLPQAFAAGSDTIRVGLVGCGGRGTGAAREALQADPHAKLVAMGDAFAEPISSRLNVLKKQKGIEHQVDVPEEQQFAGLDAYKKVIDACDVVLLASPPGFRPEHLAYAVEKGKHIFAEKPVATDGPGLRSVMESVKIAKAKNLSLVAGFCWRYDPARAEFFGRLLDGSIGEILCGYTTYLTSPVKPMPPASSRPAGMTDMQWMVHNWYNFTWLSGDGLVEQAVHAVDWLAWAQQDRLPVRCTALGGRQIPAKGGDIYDHVSVSYVWENGARSFIDQRQMSGCDNDNSGHFIGTKGQGIMDRRSLTITGPAAWERSAKSEKNMYQVEHDVLFKSIRDGLPVNDGDRLVSSTLMAIMGRNSAYTGKDFTPEMVLESKVELVPQNITWETPVKFDNPPLPGISRSV